jgi:hypothetical protein
MSNSSGRDADLATSLKLSGKKRELARAMIIGCFADGTPVIYPELSHSAANDFLYGP